MSIVWSTSAVRRPRYSVRKPDGTPKTMGELMKAKLTVREYGRYLASLAAAPNKNNQ